MYIVMWSSLVSRSQKVRVFTWDSFLQMVKNISVLCPVVHLLNEPMVGTTLVFNGHLCHHIYFEWPAQYISLIMYFKYELWWCVNCPVKRWHSYYFIYDICVQYRQDFCWLFNSAKHNILMNQVLKIKCPKPNWLWYL
jgi:hypothetical protein